MNKLKYTFKTDILFKMIFVKYPKLLKQLVSALLGISLESIGQFAVTNPEMPPENFGGKSCRLDINMIVDGQLVDLEIQVRDEGAYPERVLFNWARDYSSALPASEHYNMLPRAIVISIINFNLFDCEQYHSEFAPLEVSRHTLLSDKMSLHFFELQKLPEKINADDMLLLWLSLFKAETEEELEKIKTLEVPVMNQAIKAYKHMSKTERRNIQRMLELGAHDQAQRIHFEAKQLAQELAQDMAQDIAKDIAQDIAKDIAQDIAKDIVQKAVADKDAEIARLRAELENR